MAKGFTLVELLVVIAIIIILAVVGLVVYRDLSAQARDATRVTDMAELVNAIRLATHDATDPALAFCSGTTPPCTGTTYPTNSNTYNTDGSGWVLVDFDEKNIATFNQLPVDPLNNATYYYTYTSDGEYWKITGALESIKYKEKMERDGGTNDLLYEVGIGVKNL